jgi:hypothetical protein
MKRRFAQRILAHVRRRTEPIFFRQAPLHEIGPSREPQQSDTRRCAGVGAVLLPDTAHAVMPEAKAEWLNGVLPPAASSRQKCTRPTNIGVLASEPTTAS